MFRMFCSFVLRSNNECAQRKKIKSNTLQAIIDEDIIGRFSVETKEYTGQAKVIFSKCLKH